MKAGELRKLLQSMDDETLVVLSRDAEGNGYSPLGGIYLGAYADGKFGIHTLTDIDREHGYSEDDIVHGPAAICFWPV